MKSRPPIQSVYSAEQRESLALTKAIREATNVQLEYIWEAPDTIEDAEQKKNIAIASGDIPDFMLCSATQLAMLAKTDLINKDLESLYNTYASDHLKGWNTKEGNTALEAAYYKGQMIAIPLLGSSIDAAPFLFLRQDWLDKLGLSVPTNMDELYNVMKAFKEQDPDGNGKDDTFGMNIHKDFNSPSAMISDGVGIFNSFGAYPTYWVEDGKGGLMYGAVAPEVKDALAFLKKLYDEGLIEEDFQVKDEGKAIESIAAGKVGVEFGASWNPVFPLYMGFGQDENMRWVAAPIVGENGPAHPQAKTNIQNFVVISSECKHPEAVIKLLNAYVEALGFSDAETYNSYLAPTADGLMQFPQHYFMLKTENPLQYLEDWYLICKAEETGDESVLTSANAKSNYADNMALKNGDLSKLGASGIMGTSGSSYAAMAYYYENNLFHWDLFTGAPTKSMGSKMGLVESKILEYYTKVIMGSASLNDWDGFVSELNSLGLADVTAEVNEWYSTK